MKSLLLILTGLILFTPAHSQNVQRSFVVLEIGTGLGCTYCPGATRAADSLIHTGKSVAVIEYHYADSLTTEASMSRLMYYFFQGIPDGHFDGVINSLGGEPCPNGNVYTTYLPLYEQRYAVSSPLILGIAGTYSGNVFNLVISVLKVGAIASSDLTLHVAVTENHVPVPLWPGSAGCMTEANYLMRRMVPDHLGTPVNFDSSDMQIYNLSFDKAGYWALNHLELIAFVQENTSKEILNGTKVALNALPLPMTVDFSASPVTGCTPFTSTFSASAPAANTYRWSFAGATPASSTLANPAVTYATQGTHDVSLIAWNSANGVGNKMIKPGYIVANALPGIPSTPQGEGELCTNPPDQTYITTSVAGAASYTWEISPSMAGALTPSGTTCVINFTDTWTGSATLKVRAVNGCGDGSWSAPLVISVSDVPTQPGMPTGPSSLCLNNPDTDYSTTGGTPLTSYQWELTPPESGSPFPAGQVCTIDWSDTFTGVAQLRVRGLNNGCEGPWSEPLAIILQTGPVAFQVTGGGAWCQLTGNGAPVGLDGSQTGIQYTLFLDGQATSTVLQGTGTALAFGNQQPAGNYTIHGVIPPDGCSNNMNGNAIVATDPQEPSQAGDITGPVHVYSGATPSSEFNSPGALNATAYEWQMEPPEAGVITGNGSTGTVDWNQDFAGEAVIDVKGINSCGAGLPSADFAVLVDVGVALPEQEEVKEVKLWPNPAGEFIHVRVSASGVSMLEITGLTGTRLLRCDINSNQTALMETRSLAKGLYLVRITTEKRSYVFKLIRQ